MMEQSENELLQKAETRGYLATFGDDQQLFFTYKMRQREQNRPAICLAINDRHVELSVYLNGCALTETAKMLIGYQLAFVQSPFSTALINNKRIVVTRLTFDAGYQLVVWLASELNKPEILIPGERKERHHARIEVRKRWDGSLWFAAGLAYFGRDRRQTAA